MPDAAFDCVICINTLEHLLKTQRDALIAAMARKLKPGGWLILTSDYYFDAFWRQPVFLQAGVMRADGSEIFTGGRLEDPNAFETFLPQVQLADFVFTTNAACIPLVWQPLGP